MMLHIHARKDDKQGYVNTAACVCLTLASLFTSLFWLAALSAQNIWCSSRFLSENAENFSLCSLLPFSATPSSPVINVWPFGPLAQIKTDDASALCLVVQRRSCWSPGDSWRHLALIKPFVAAVSAAAGPSIKICPYSCPLECELSPAVNFNA